MEEQNTTKDLLLLDRLRRGDHRSIEILFHQYWEPLYATAVSRLQHPAEAQDVVQSLFTDLWQRREQLNVKTSLKAYLYTALKYTILDHIRTRVVREKYVQAIQHVASTSYNSTAETVAYRELERKVDQGISSLPERCRQVFRMRRLEHHSVKEIANTLGISPKTVENQLTKATKVLRVHLKEYIAIFLLIVSQLP